MLQSYPVGEMLPPDIVTLIRPHIPDNASLSVGRTEFLFQASDFFDISFYNTAMVFLDIKISFAIFIISQNLGRVSLLITKDKDICVLE